MASDILRLSIISIVFCKEIVAVHKQGNALVLVRKTWLLGFNDCKNVHNLTMASVEDINERLNLAPELEKYLPVWTYAFEISHNSSGKTIRITSNDISKDSNVFSCSGSLGETVTGCCSSLSDAQNKCREKLDMELDIPVIHQLKLDQFSARFYINSSRWVQLKNNGEEEFLQGIENWSVRCLILSEKRELRTDDCNEDHYTLCIPDTSNPVATFVDKERLPHYTSSTTFSSPTLSDNTNMGALVIGCGSAVALIVIVAVAVAFMRKRRMNQSGRNANVRFVPEETNYISPISDDERHEINTTVQGNDAVGANDGYEIPSLQRNVYESLGERQDEEHGYGIPIQETSGFYQPLEVARSDAHDYEITQHVAYDALVDIRMQTAAYDWVE